MRKLNLFSRFALAACNIYGLTLTTLLLMRFVIGERPLIYSYSPVGLLNSMFAIALIPSGLTLVLCLLLRHPGSAALQLAPFIVFCVVFGGNFLPRSLANYGSGQTLSVMSYNLLFNNFEYDVASAVIRSADADIVAFQEFTEGAAQYMGEEFATEYPYQVFYPLDTSTHGCGIMSRYPIVEDEAWQDVMMQQEAVMRVGDERVTIFNVHPPVPVLYGANAGSRGRVIKDILDRASEASGRVMLVGDFNMGEASEDYDRVIEAGYTDSFRVAGYGLGLSFPDWRKLRFPLRLLPPLSRIDYVFYSDGFQAVEAWTSHTSGGSDHRPIYAELTLE